MRICYMRVQDTPFCYMRKAINKKGDKMEYLKPLGKVLSVSLLCAHIECWENLGV